MMKKINILSLFVILLVAFGCDKDKLAEINTPVSELDEAVLEYSATQAIKQMYRNDYTIWFYNNNDYYYPWTQVTASGNGNGPDFNEMGIAEAGQGYLGDLIRAVRDIQAIVDKMPEEEKARHQAMKAITYPITIQPALTQFDNVGSLFYSEAGYAQHTNPPLLKPTMDTQAELVDTWLNELALAAKVLADAENQQRLGNQDLIYGGDYARWAKYCNLLRLKIAARIINHDKAKALKVAEDVVNSSAGYMNTVADDFIYQRGTNFYGTGNGLGCGTVNKALADFLMDNLDPRVKLYFRKNDFNGEVVQEFIDEGKALPPYVAKYVNTDADGNFDGWKAPGEPWVRYHGIPISPDEKNIGDNDIYFNQADLYKITKKVDEKTLEKTYAATSQLNEKLFRTTYDYTYPTKVGGRVIQLKDNDPPLTVILGSSAETNLYLAEFKLLGANLPKSAQEYFNQGVTLSIERANLIAKNHQLPYFKGDPVYINAEEAAAARTELRDGEVASYLAKPICDLSVDGLEKVYIQQYVNFINTPYDLWTTVRRSGVPKKNSPYLAWVPFIDSGAEVVLPRRNVINTPTEDDLNYANKKSGIEAQGFTTGTNLPATLNSERLWFDKNNPKYGNGPK
jgi:hypothetical protein